jgi:4-amino-4-deoxy-L-arabinose transferase-like glycosyltransferase
MIVLALFIAGIWMRLHLLDAPFDRDSYDEGVYWESLRSMSVGASLYQRIFDSQPPFFLLSIYPFYALFGQTIWSARLGIAIISLFGFLGALLLGKALAGRLGMILALLLLVANSFYLTASQTLQADGPATALALLAVGLACLWWERPDGTMGYCLASLTGMTLALSILTKLLMIPALAPIGLLALVRLWQVKNQTSTTFFASIRPLLIGCLAFVLTIVLLLLPFSHAFSQFWQTVVMFHVDARGHYADIQAGNSAIIGDALKSLLGASALFGTIIALLRRDWRVIPLLVWLSTTIDFLLEQAPLFSYHLIALIPPLIALTVIGIAPITLVAKRSGILINIATALTALLVLSQVISNIQPIQNFYDNSVVMSHLSGTQQNMRVVRDLQRLTRPDQLVITDAEFIAALAGRSTPDSLVDTSEVRIRAGYLTTQQLIEEASQPQVHAILFYTYRFDNELDASFHDWVTQHFQLADRYEEGEELWVKTEPSKALQSNAS